MGDEATAVKEEEAKEDEAKEDAPVPDEGESPILTRLRVEFQEGSQVILSGHQTLKEWERLSAIRMQVEVKARQAIDARGDSQPPGPLPFDHEHREEVLEILRQDWLDSGAPANKKCAFEGTQKEWEEKQKAEGHPDFKTNRFFERACRTHFNRAMTKKWGSFALPLFIRLGYIDLELLQSIDIEAKKRREEDARATPVAPSRGASEPAATDKQEGRPTAD